MNVSFAWPHALWLLLLPAGLLITELVRRVRAAAPAHPKIMRAEASPRGLALVAASPAGAARRVRWRLWFGLALASAAIARPQWGEVEEPVFEQSREILIAVDLSRSMLAPDVAPSRLQRAKLLITSLLERLEGERVGLVVFAGTSFVQSPLSADYEILREFLPELSPDFLPQGGTDYAAMLDSALEAFGKDTGADRYLIVLSDGEAQTETWQERMTKLRERNIRVIALGVGTAEGAVLPDGKGGFIKDDRGAVVLSRLNSATLEDLARRTNGVYKDASKWVDLAELLQHTVEAGRHGDFSETRRARRIERFQWALAPALLFLLWSLWREFPVQPRQRATTIKTGIRKAATTVAAVAAVAFIHPPVARAAEKVETSPANATEPQLPPPPITRPPIPATGGAGPSRASSTTAKPSDTPPLEAPLTTLITKLAQQPKVGATGYADIANQTLTYGQRVKSAGQKPQPSVIYDALDAVDAGEKLDRKAADWPKLRDELRKMLQEDDQQQQQQQKQDDKNQDKPDQQQQPQNGSGKGNGQDQQSKDQQNQGDKGDKDQSGDQQQNSEKSSDDPSKPEKPSDESGNQDQKRSQDQSDQDESSKDGKPRPPQQRQNAFGDLDDKQPPPQPPPGEPSTQPPPPDPGTQKIGGQSTQSADAARNPELAVPLQKLDQLKKQDSPAVLYQRLQNPASTPTSNGHDW